MLFRSLCSACANRALIRTSVFIAGRFVRVIPRLSIDAYVSLLFVLSEKPAIVNGPNKILQATSAHSLVVFVVYYLLTVFFSEAIPEVQSLFSVYFLFLAFLYLLSRKGLSSIQLFLSVSTYHSLFSALKEFVLDALSLQIFEEDLGLVHMKPDVRFSQS